jgi:DNA-binding transcriptional ArsR family regulator
MSFVSVPEEETYSVIFASLKHPIRRKILRILRDKHESFSGLQRQFRIESSHLTYHLDGLGSLLIKTEDGKYALSSLGEAAVSMMKNVEEPLGAPLLPIQPTRRLRIWKLLAVLLICGLVASLVFSGVILFKYTAAGEAYDRLEKAFDGLDQEYSELNRTYGELDGAFDRLNETYVSLLSAQSQSGGVYDLNTGLNYTTIQGAINAAKDGDTIVVTSGV